MTRADSLPAGTVVIDPLAPVEPGSYRDQLVDVICEDLVARPFEAATPIAETRHFCLYRRGRRVQVSHWLRPEQLDNDIAGMLATELFDPGWLSGNGIFERVLTGVVRSAVTEPVQAWETFYANTMARMREEWSGRGHGAAHSTIAGIAPVYARALRFVPPGRVLDMGSCFGFFSLLLAERRRNTVTASDISAGSMRLLGTIADAWRLPLTTTVCDAACVPLPDRAVDTVTVLHLLEHLDPVHGLAVVREALRLACRRVVIAVPYEDEPNAIYGHVRRFDAAMLTEIGMGSGRRFGVSEHHGGWLVASTS
ncbi:MAG: mycofactocin oligosaccharide methyltransferase MftM [Sciscionella sp.]